MQIDVTIGWTRSSLPEYSSFSDGYRPGASQHTESITFDFEPDGDPEQDVIAIAEGVFYATNSPFVAEGSLAGRIADAIKATGYRGQTAHYSLSVGDTVTVGEVTMACDDWGWKRVSLTEATI